MEEVPLVSVLASILLVWIVAIPAAVTGVALLGAALRERRPRSLVSIGEAAAALTPTCARTETRGLVQRRPVSCLPGRSLARDDR